ncbi:hypothetical protein FB451DRAFT_1187990 [Mycena latifolia]|nr:hypothetical protein FB451DRAFT_1187990 [Mycena latifolia]
MADLAYKPPEKGRAALFTPQLPCSLHPQREDSSSHFDLPRDHAHSDHPSPVKRYAGKTRRREPSPTPSRSSTDNPDDSEEQREDSPIENLEFFDLNIPNPPQSPSVDATALTTTPPALAPSPSTTAQSAPPSPSPSVQALSPSLSRTVTPHPDHPMEDIDEVFKAPTRAEFLAAAPTCQDENPHRPSAAHDPGSKKALTQYAGFQANNPLWGAAIIPDHVALDNMSDETQEAVRAAPDQYLAATPFCSGATLYDKHKNMCTDLLTIIEEVTGKGTVTVIMPQPKVTPKQARRRPAGKPNKFAGPVSMLVRCSDPQLRSELTDQSTFAADRLLAFHVTLFNAALLSWAVGFFKTDINNQPDATALRLRWAVYEKLTKASPAPKATGLIDRATQGGNTLSHEKRLLDFASTLDVRYLPHADNPVYVLYAKPCTQDAKLWDEICAALRITYTDLLEAFIPHANTATGHNLCADCKLNCHPKYNCMFTVRDKDWWGPRGLESILKLLRGGDSESEGEVRETVIGNSGIVGGGSSATGDRPTDEDARSGGEMADARPPGRAEATPGAVRLQGGTSMSALPIQRHEPIQRHDSRPSNDEDPPYWDYQHNSAEGGNRAPAVNETHTGNNSP